MMRKKFSDTALPDSSNKLVDRGGDPRDGWGRAPEMFLIKKILFKIMYNSSFLVIRLRLL